MSDGPRIPDEFMPVHGAPTTVAGDEVLAVVTSASAVAMMARASQRSRVIWSVNSKTRCRTPSLTLRQWAFSTLKIASAFICGSQLGFLSSSLLLSLDCVPPLR